MTAPIERLAEALAPRYDVEREIGRGGMATVYLARDTKHGRPVAIKVYRDHGAWKSGAERFLTEIQLTANLQHPNILSLYDSGQIDGLVYYVMPYVDGETLEDRLRNGPLELEETVGIVRSVAHALQYAHDQGIVHRDVKPSNILFQGGEAVVADFGIALALSEAGSQRLTVTGSSLGTALYMSPEQAEGEGVDGRSDQYSLACVIYQMLTGEPPYPGPSFVSVIAKHITEPVPSLSDALPDLGDVVAGVLTRGLAKDAADRFASVEEFSKAFERAAVGERPFRPFGVPKRAVTFAVAAAVAIGWWLSPDAQPLDPNRVVVFPLVTGGDGLSPSAGEDVATTIGHALDGTASLRWIDGWTLLDEEAKSDVRQLSLAEASSLARGRGSAYFVTGRVLGRGDSTDVLLDLMDVEGDSVVIRSQATGSSDGSWRVGLNAVNGFLPVLIGSTPERFGRDLFDRRPEAVANFLLAERLFRRARGSDALDAYTEAFAADTTFALAAMRGARAATWEHDDDIALAMINAAMGLPLDPRDRLFGQGIQAKLLGHADTAMFFFESAIATDSAFAEGWIQLGETAHHLAPKRPGSEGITITSLERALAADPTATNALYHLLEEEIRDGHVQESARLDRFLAADPQENLSTGLLLARDCVAGSNNLDLEAATLAVSTNVTVTGSWLSTGGKQLDCAERFFRAALTADTATDAAAEGRLGTALTGLHSVLIARGKSDDAIMLLDSARVSTDALRRVAAGADGWFGSSPPGWDRETRLRARHLVIWNEIIGIDVGSRSEAVADEDLVEWGDDLGDAYSDDLWRRTVWEAWRGNLEEAARFQAALEERLPNSTERVQVLAQVLRGHLALARGDSAGALAVFAGARPRAPDGNLAWHFAYALGLERLLESRLLLADGDHRGAIDVAGILDDHPIIFLQFLRPSLEVRIQAAEALGERRLADSFRQRLLALGNS